MLTHALYRNVSSFKTRGRGNKQKKAMCSVKFRSSEHNAWLQRLLRREFVFDLRRFGCLCVASTEAAAKKNQTRFVLNGDERYLVTASLNIKSYASHSIAINKVHGGFCVNQRFLLRWKRSQRGRKGYRWKGRGKEICCA